ncbi:nuclear transport factor 2 family protein [Aestuariibacter halophilus]|uniref:Nuclear transport factor 2 family protein n=1 Tax=Fluctibacter halophilus TaxID=226011 RepID=A0ABS8G4D4_9ALTE|nr:nuclear transport factor 2 family protein [Aestuariibacter halophilus]MCC2615388.1 nuclear transport factor 2 family protein [Aestuariibacter halophilus]
MRSILLIGSLMVCASLHAKQSLYDTIAQLDTQLFSAANAGQLDRVMDYFSNDLEFYHDTGGLGDYQQTRNSLQQMFASPHHPTRTLVEGSMAVYPIQDFGAIQTGKHRFCHEENGKQDCGTFDFVHIWQHTPEGWKIRRVVSYGH